MMLFPIPKVVPTSTCPVPSEPLDAIKELVEKGVYIGCETASLD